MHMIDRNSPCWCGSGRKYKKCHYDFDEKLMAYEHRGCIVPEHNMIKTPEQIEKIKASAQVNIAVLDYVAEHIKEGVTTEDIDRWVYEETTRRGAIPAPLNYEGFPKSVCTSIDEVVCHGIPDPKRVLKEIKPWNFLGDMGSAIHDFVRENGYSVVREIGGHGIGLEFHEEPWVSYVSEKGTEMLMVPGMMFTIEPMINMGKPDVFVDEDDGWTVYTEDGLPSAQWEIQVLVTEDGYEIISY